MSPNRFLPAAVTHKCLQSGHIKMRPLRFQITVHLLCFSDGSHRFSQVCCRSTGGPQVICAREQFAVMVWGVRSLRSPNVSLAQLHLRGTRSGVRGSSCPCPQIPSGHGEAGPRNGRFRLRNTPRSIASPLSPSCLSDASYQNCPFHRSIFCDYQARRSKDKGKSQ